MVTLLDGALGTELIARGVPAPLPAWSAHALVVAPETVAAVHRAYAASGATIHTANTFRTKRRTFPRDWVRLVRRAVSLARGAVPGTHRVAGSIAPLEDCYRPDLSPGADARAEHRELARALAAAKVDLLLCETFAHPREAQVAVEEAVATGVETWVALTAGPLAELLSPSELANAARDCIEAGARAVLVNCTAASRTLPYVRRLSLAALDVPFGAYANAGAVDEGIGWGSGPSGAEAYARWAGTWVDAGATLVGGCCGTSPLHTAKLAERFGPGSARG